MCGRTFSNLWEKCILKSRVNLNITHTIVFNPPYEVFNPPYYVFNNPYDVYNPPYDELYLARSVRYHPGAGRGELLT